DAEYFFGREAEVEAVWGKLPTAQLLGVIGASGSGKSSFLGAGLVPARPEGWAVVRCTPGTAAVDALRRAIYAELQSFPEAIQDLAAGGDSAIVQAFGAWRHERGQALLIVDQFEELFTQNLGEEQRRCAEALGRIALDADVHVLLSMRDDFLMRCHDHESLAPIFSELTPLKPPVGGALRRAVVQPALRCGYRFEDEALADEILAEVEGERGALPLLAFALARLWEKRDRENGLITRQAYRDIGGVGGALAQHAEALMERLGTERHPIVRELFRNLVTAEGTRAARDSDELLSVFRESRKDAGEVLRALIDARLLTSYELPSDDGPGRQRVEVIHESLISHWPRLVGWRTQDADSARLRDELRQAARQWHEHGRIDDRLWTGSLYREYAVWRERYPGGLTELEEAFAGAMDVAATRRRRRRRIAAASALALAVVVAAVFGTLWRRSVLETRRTEASKLLALGQLRLADHPNAALAYAIASLERADNDPARRFAVEALWQGPPALFLQGPNPWSVTWSPDGRWLALGGSQGVEVLERETGAARRISSALERTVGFTSDGRRLVTRADEGAPPMRLNVWALPEGRLERTLGHAEVSGAVLVADRLLTLTFDSPEPIRTRSIPVRTLSLDGTTEQELGLWRPRGWVAWDVDPTGTFLFSLQGGRLIQQRLDDLSAPGRLVGTHEGEVEVWVWPWRDRAVTGDSTGEVRIWDVPSARLERTLRSPADAGNIALDPQGRFLATAGRGAGLPLLFDLTAPRVAQPAPLLADVDDLLQMRFSPDGSWLATVHNGNVILWNMAGRLSMVLGSHESIPPPVAFTPDGDLLSSSNDGVLRRWPLSPVSVDVVRELWSGPREYLAIFAMDPAGRFVVVSWGSPNQIIVVPLDDSPATSHRLKFPEGVNFDVLGASLDPGARFLALAASTFGYPELNGVRILDLSTGEERVLDTHPEGPDRCEEPGSSNWGYAEAVWLRDGRLVSDGDAGLRIWDLATGSSRLLRPCRKLQPSTGLVLLATPDSGTVLRLDMAIQVGETSSLSAFDLASGDEREILSHGNRLVSLDLDPTGTILVTGDRNGVIRVGPLTGEEPHLLFGHTGPVWVAVSPDGRWIASSDSDGTARLWPMPDLTKPPLHTLPHDELLAKLKSLTNLRAVPDETSGTGWRLEVGPFPGWATVPEWNP
ncbi:MAG: hypothetical protein C3F15_06440, partial [Holophagae bacterium]